MKAEARVLDVTSTIQGEHIGMTIDSGAMAHIMSILTDLYADTELACVREYSTNAWDSHVEAGITRPIEVDTPTNLSPFLKIRDYGIGLDLEGIREIYSKYGASTKRQSNDVVGMLGLGCKSALTYTNQFTVTGVKNGVMIQVSVSRDENGAGSMTVLDEAATAESDGVEILIPARRGNYFESKAQKFFRFWEPGSVLLNGKPPEQIKGVWITDDLLITMEAEESYVVMGNVPYPMGREILGQIRSGYSYNNPKVVAFVPIGDITFTPSRESLMSTKGTEATLNRIQDRVAKEKNPAFERKIAKANSKEEALQAYFDAKEVGYTGKNPHWNGKELRLKWTPPSTGEKDWRNNPIPGSYKAVDGQRYAGQRHRTHSIHEVPNDLNAGHYGWIKNFDGADMTAYKRAKLDQYIKNNKLDHPKKWVLVDNLPEEVTDWFDSKFILDWSVVSLEKIVREQVERRDGRPSGSYAGFVDGEYVKGILADKIDTSKPIYYEHGSVRWGYAEESHPLRSFKTDPNFDKCTIILLGSNRIKKFRRDFPQAKELSVALKEMAKNWSDNLTEDQKMRLYFSDNQSIAIALSRLSGIKASLHDAELVKAVDMASQASPGGLLAAWKRWHPWGAKFEYKFENPAIDYPLLQYFSGYARLDSNSQEHLAIYLNAAYAARKEA